VLRFLGLPAVVFAVFSVLVASQSVGVSAAPSEFVIEATGSEEVNVVTDGGSAVGVFTFDATTSEITYDINVHGISANLVTAAHIHRGAAGVSGPPVITLSMGGETSFSGSATLSAAEVTDLEAGNFYFNVHSVEHPGGFARGQLILPKTAGPAISPPSTGDAGLLPGDSASQTAWIFVAVVGALAVSAGIWTVRKAA